MRTLIACFKLAGVALTLAIGLSFFQSATAAPLNQRAADRERYTSFVEDIQESLYVLKYLKLDDVDGTAGPKTAIAIRRFESDHGLTVSGRLTDELRQLLVDMAFPDLPTNPELVGAVSVGGDLKWGGSYGRYTTEVALASAIRRCQQRSRSRKNCEIHVPVATGHEWIVTVICGRTYTSSIGESREAARRNAVAEARKEGIRSNCNDVLIVNATFGEVIDAEEEYLLSRPMVNAPVPTPRSRTGI